MSTKPPDRSGIFHAAADLQDPAERAAYLDGVCGEDAQLRAEIEELLAHDGQAGSFLELPAGGPAATVDLPEVAEGVGTVIGRYKLRQRIGEGGFGIVFVAEQLEPVQRKVALKIIKPGMDTRQVIARFEAERQALALMDHPNIARVFDAGTTQSGRPYFVMELIKGCPIIEYCDERHLTLRERLELLVPVCQAIQHAHQKGIIHRDIKPSNVLVADYDERAVPKVIDFGVAKALGQRLTEKSIYTDLGRVVGTIEYMSPEQAKLNQWDVDTRSDVYSLGVLLYELIAGQTPFDRARLHSAAFDELLRIIREEEPPKPSRRLSASQSLPSIAANRRVEPKKLGALVRGDLDWIVMKALEKDRNRRYDTATAFAADIERFLRNEPVEAGPPSTAYRVRKFISRQKTAVAVAAAIAAVIVLGTVGTTIGMITARAEARRADRQAEQLRTQLRITDGLAAQEAWDESNVGRVEELLRRHASEPRGFEWYHFWKLCQQNRETAKQIPTPDSPHRLAYSPDGTLIAVAHPRGGFVTVWNVKTGQKVREFGARNRSVWIDNTCTAFLSSGQTVLRRGDDKGIVLCDLVSGEERTLGADGDVSCIAVCHEKNWIVTAEPLRVWDAESGKQVAKPVEACRGVTALAVARDGRILISGHSDGSVKVWQLPAGERLKDLGSHLGSAFCVAVSPDGKTAASGGDDNMVRIWDLQTGQRIRELTGFRDCVRAVAFSPNGEMLAAHSRDQTVRVWNVPSLQERETLRAAQGGFSLAFSPDSSILACGGARNRITLWNMAGRDAVEILRPESAMGQLAMSRDGRILASVLRLEIMVPRVAVWDLQDRNRQPAILSAEDLLSCVALDGSGARLAAGGVGRVHLWDLRTKRKLEPLRAGSAKQLLTTVFSPDGRILAASNEEGSLVVWDVGSGRLLHEFRAHAHKVQCLAFTPDSKTLASGSWDGTIRVWNVQNGSMVRSLSEHEDGVLGLAFSPDGTILASGCFDSTIKLWDWSSEEEKAETLTGHGLAVDSVLFSADGRTLLSTSGDRTIRLWDVPTRQLRCILRGHAARVTCSAWSADNTLLATGSWDGTIRLWRAATEEEVSGRD